MNTVSSSDAAIAVKPNYLSAIFFSGWPFLATLLFFCFLYFSVGTGKGFDASTWPSALQPECGADHERCAAIRQMDVIVRIVTMTAAFFPLGNTYNHFRSLIKIAERRKDGRGSREVASIFVFVSLIFNVYWVGATWNFKFDHESSLAEWIIFVIFGIFALTDLILMWIHRSDTSEEGRFHYNYLFGSAFFIDIPTLVGVFIIMKFSEAVINERFGLAANEIALALSGGALVMHVVISQIVFVFLQMQLRLYKAQYA